MLLGLLFLLLAISALLTWVLRQYALKHQLIDVPNARSSHVTPTPRGGGVAIVLSSLAALAWMGISDTVPWGLIVALLGAGGGIAVLGFLDDHGHVAARWRLLGHFLAAAWMLYWVGGFPSINILGLDLEFGRLGYLIGALYIVWLLNLYNFMDGIDGLASIQAICACLGGVAILWTSGSADGSILVMLALAASVGGFLLWNFPPAKIFMGDAGSGFLGVMLAGLSIHAGWINVALLWAWLVLLGVFIVDATFTLMRRILRGERIYEAHRSHAYQRAARLSGSHRFVSLAVLAINAMWLMPIALCIAAGRIDGPVGMLLAYCPLIILTIKYRAGDPD